MVEKLGLSLSLDTDKTPVHGVPGVSRYFSYLSVLNVNQYAAIAVAGLADTPDYILHVHLSIPYFTLKSTYEQERFSGVNRVLTCIGNFCILATSPNSPIGIHRNYVFTDLRNIHRIIAGYQ